MLLFLTIPFAVVLWFVMVRPQQQRVKEHQAMVAELQAGDQVVSAGGIHGYLVSVDDETVQMEVAEGVVLTLARAAISRKVSPEEDQPDDPAVDADVFDTEQSEPQDPTGKDQA